MYFCPAKAAKAKPAMARVDGSGTPVFSTASLEMTMLSIPKDSSLPPVTVLVYAKANVSVLAVWLKVRLVMRRA